MPKENISDFGLIFLYVNALFYSSPNDSGAANGNVLP